MNDEQLWPAPEALMSLPDERMITDKRARCIGVAVCDEQGKPLRTFQQGQAVHFFYEFEVLSQIAVPIGGLEFRDSSGRVIHGKNSLQFDAPLPQQVYPGERLRYHHTIKLDVAPGYYTVTVGLASVHPDKYRQHTNGQLHHEALHAALVEHCRATDCSVFQVILPSSGRLQHYGLADLPGTSIMRVTASTGHTVADMLPSDELLEPAIFHVTHWKAGSQWIYGILRAAVPERIIRPVHGGDQFLARPLETGKVYPTVYVTRQQFESVRMPAAWRRFVMIRDLRDTLVSGYFSIKISHPIMDAPMEQTRETLVSSSQEDGMLLLMRKWLFHSALIQQSWLETGEPLIRYEDMLENDVEILEQVLIDQCKLPVDRTVFRKIVVNNRFERLSRGRQRGQEEVTSHVRKGVAGDWQNYFTEPMKNEFKQLYGELLIATGYEQDNNW
jgi:hypothetical protein